MKVEKSGTGRKLNGCERTSANISWLIGNERNRMRIEKKMRVSERGEIG